MNAVIVNQQSAVVKAENSTAWQWGFEDAVDGEYIYAGNAYFVGPQLREYRQGWMEGKASLGQPTVVTPDYVPFQDPELFKDLLPDYMREDYVGA